MPELSSVVQPQPFTIGIDTGGTFTDALIYCPTTDTIVNKVKVPTNHGQLDTSIHAALGQLLIDGNILASDIACVSVSTTLATNALVEGAGRPAALVAIGLGDTVMDRGALPGLLENNPHVRLQGGHSSHGDELDPLDTSPLTSFLSEVDQSVEGFAIVGAFSVRNPSHELEVANLIRHFTEMPVTLSCDLSAQLNAPKRAVTALLNARLVPLITRLLEGVKRSTEQYGISAPLMIMRGDGSLVSSDFVASKPIETILSGPAASAVGAAALSSLHNGLVVDIGGTTTDVAVIAQGKPVAAQAGAVVGGYETMVNAIRVHTEGIGGDSYVAPQPLSRSGFTVGPQRATPLVVLAAAWPNLTDLLKSQHLRDRPKIGDGQFLYLRQGRPSLEAASTAEEKILSALVASEAPVEYSNLIETSIERTATKRLISQELIDISSFTPTDALHLLGLDQRFASEPAQLGAALLARQLDHVGLPLARDARDFAAKTITRTVNRIAHTVLYAAADNDGFKNEALTTILDAIEELTVSGRAGNLLNLHVAPSANIAVVGAPALILSKELDEILKASCDIPDTYEVANAFGAAVGRVTVSNEIVVSAPSRGKYLVHDATPKIFYDLEAAKSFAETQAVSTLRRDITQAGAVDFEISNEWDVQNVWLDGRSFFVEAVLRSVASGSPF